jgi:hypothetical protein
VECLASALVQTIKPVPPTEGRAKAVATDGIVCSAGGCGSAALGGLSGEDCDVPPLSKHG